MGCHPLLPDREAEYFYPRPVLQSCLPHSCTNSYAGVTEGLSQGFISSSAIKILRLSSRKEQSAACACRNHCITYCCYGYICRTPGVLWSMLTLTCPEDTVPTFHCRICHMSARRKQCPH